MPISFSSLSASCAHGSAYISINSPVTETTCNPSANMCIDGIAEGCSQKTNEEFAASIFGSTASYMGIIRYDPKYVQ